MPVLKFSADYEKLPEAWMDSEAVLLAVTKTQIGYLLALPEFLNNDTKVFGEELWYDLPEDPYTDVLVLIFTHSVTGRLFSTIRVWKEDKEKYYRSNILEPFTLKFTPPEEGKN